MRFKKLCFLRFPQRNEYEDKDLPKRMKSPKDKFSGLLSDRTRSVRVIDTSLEYYINV